jgi:clan AA aspartic protease
MVKGNFSGLSPTIDIHIQKREFRVLIDTGFNGALMLPKSEIKKLKLKNIGKDNYITASGNQVVTEIYMAEILWFGRLRKIAVLSTEGQTRLIGMELLFNQNISINGFKNKIEIS